MLGLLAAPADQNSAATAGADLIGTELRQSFVWAKAGLKTNESLHVGFRRTFELAAVPVSAQIHLFAYTRYQLFVNGEYVGRGPNRFENRRPEYDTWDIAARLHAGSNVIAVLVHRDWPGKSSGGFGRTLSRIRRHEAGFTAQLELADGSNKTIIKTDESWRAFVETGFGQPLQDSYASIPENYDAQKSPGEWTAENFDDHNFPSAEKIDVANHEIWPPLSPRTIPLLREKEAEFSFQPASAKIVLTNGNQWKFTCRQIVQAYWVLDLDAEAGTKLLVTPLLPEGKHAAPSVYVCRAGKQRWMGGDTFAFNALSVRVESGKATLLKSRLMEVIYPFERAGSFSSSDPMLDQVWNLTARSLELLSEDAYTDCADRERSEWMDCDPPMYDATRVMEAGPGPNGAKIWSDPRLFKNMLRRVALTQEPDGMLRARTCSELVDIHTRMEDRACDWVEGLHKYYEATGDQELIRELWPECEKLLQWFADRRTTNGLVRAREWIAWDNPMSYATCEGTGNNAFIQRAFADAAWLAREIGDKSAATKWNAAAEKLESDVNRLLWDESSGAYCSALGTPEILPGDRMFRKSITLKSIAGRTEPTLHANLFALDRGLVPPERRDRVVQWILQHDNQVTMVMAHYYYFKMLYALDQERYDQIVLDRIRGGWKGMIESPWQTTWEGLDGGSKVHCYGIVPGYFLSAHVLGVRRDAPVWKHQLIIEPHLADLTHAEGVVVTEFGPVPIEWSRANDVWRFKVTVPENTEARLALPNKSGHEEISVNGKSLRGTVQGSRLVLDLKPGAYSGDY